MTITIIAGARPNFIKIAPLIEAMEIRALEGAPIRYRLVHTGQHYDPKMSRDFFDQLGIPDPHVNLQAGGGTQAEQTAHIMVRFEAELTRHPADLVLVVGDVTSTMACAIVAKKLHTKVAHVEAGIRSGDMRMPEEVNRIVTDSITDYFFTTTPTATQRLLDNGAPGDKVFFVGNTMIDTLLKQKSRFKKPPFWDTIPLREKQYLVVTLHRPANVDEPENLKRLLDELAVHSRELPLVFPVHPRTVQVLGRANVEAPNLHTTDPLGYLEFNYLVRHAKAVVTDSGGITEEATVLGVPCMTLRDSTERPETCTIGTNELLGTDPLALGPALGRLFRGEWKKGGVPELWDGHAALRIVDHLLTIFQDQRPLISTMLE